MRTVISAAAAATLALALVSCSSAEDNGNFEQLQSDLTAQLSHGFGEIPEISLQTPLEVSSTERFTAITGAGDLAASGDTVLVGYHLARGSDGVALESTGLSGTTKQVLTLNQQFNEFFVTPLIGSTEGSRIVTAATAGELLGPDLSEVLGMASADSVLFVLDFYSKMAERADGEPQSAPAGFPAVTLADNGQPSVSIPDAGAPSELQLAVLQKGDGELVPEGATVAVQYHGVKWADGEIFDQSWGRGVSQFPLGQVVQGFSAAIANQTVGSQIIAVIPPSLGYGNVAGHNLQNETLVFVIDILAVL